MISQPRSLSPATPSEAIDDSSTQSESAQVAAIQNLANELKTDFPQLSQLLSRSMSDDDVFVGGRN